MEELLARARAADADLARVRVGAKPAGEADPYRESGVAAEPQAGSTILILTGSKLWAYPLAGETPMTMSNRRLS